MGFERYVDYVLDVPMYFVYRDGKYIDVAGKSFRDFLEHRIPKSRISSRKCRIGRSPDHHLPGSEIEAISRNARRRRRKLAAHLRHARALGRPLLRSDVARCAWDMVKD